MLAMKTYLAVVGIEIPALQSGLTNIRARV